MTDYRENLQRLTDGVGRLAAELLDGMQYSNIRELHVPGVGRLVRAEVVVTEQTGGRDEHYDEYLAWWSNLSECRGALTGREPGKRYRKSDIDITYRFSASIEDYLLFANNCDKIYEAMLDEGSARVRQVAEAAAKVVNFLAQLDECTGD